MYALMLGYEKYFSFQKYLQNVIDSKNAGLYNWPIIFTDKKNIFSIVW